MHVTPNPACPVTYNIADYQPGGRAALIAGTHYYNKGRVYNFSSSDGDGLCYLTYSTSGSGSCTSGTSAINFSASNVTFTEMIFAPGRYLQVSGLSNTGLSGSFIADSIRLSRTGVHLTRNSGLCTGGSSVSSIRLK